MPTPKITNLFRFESTKQESPELLVEASDLGTMIPQEIEEVNPNFKEFNDIVIDSEENVVKNSVIDQMFASDVQSVGQHHTISTYKNIVYGRMSGDKLIRINFYRNMAGFPEVSNALDEIAEACINEDADGSVVNIEMTNLGKTLSEKQSKKIKEEFEEFISLFDFENNGFEYFRKMLIEGEITWENVINEKNPDFGIIGIRDIPAESYEYLIDETRRIQGIILNAKLLYEGDTVDTSSQYDVKDSGYYEKYWKNLNFTSQFGYSNRGKDIELVPMPMSQITHVNSGILSPDKTIVYPILEKARRAYRQLSLLEDAIIIYRLIRAPERLVFNVDVGKLPATKAEQLVLKMAKRYQTKKIYNPLTGGVTSDYDSHQMLESYWFPKPEGSQGTSVEQLGGAQNLGELEDLYYFLKKLYISLKVPWSRYDQPDNTYENGESISLEEQRFARFVIRLQKQFGKGLKEAFISHLTLTGIWDEYKMNSRQFQIKFSPPAYYDMFVRQKAFQLKVENYDLIAQHEEFSKEIAMEKFLEMSPEEIDENDKRIEKERLKMAMIERKVANIEDHGTPDEVTEELDADGNPKDFRW